MNRQRLAETLAEIREKYPRTARAFEDMEALPQLAAVIDLDHRWNNLERGVPLVDAYRETGSLPAADDTWDLIYAGGGLGLLHALAMCRRGYRVLVFDRGEVGRSHREWNISDQELRALVHSGIFDDAEVESFVAHRHASGVVRFHAETVEVPPAEICMRGVLDVSLDSGALLRCARRKLEQAGGEILDGCRFRRVQADRHGVVVQVERDDGSVRWLGARLLLDGMGSTSPLALERYRGRPFAGICPTVGSVVTGLEPGSGAGQHNPAVGDILISVADVQRGRQLIWEGFAGADDDLTIYLFFYDRVGPKRSVPHSLLELFEDYFTLLPTYKRPGAHFRHIRPVYGFIPARHTERRTTVLPLRGVLPIGDAAAQQSPLTFTGFGSHVRNLHRTTSLLDYALRNDLLEPRWLNEISAYQANVALHWVFSRFMQPWEKPNDVNRLQNVFARVLNELGDGVAERFFKDQMRWGDYGRIVNHTLAVYRPIIPTALKVLGARDTVRWIVDYIRFSRAALAAAAGRRLDNLQWHALERIAERVHPGLALLLRSRQAEWGAMGWLPRD
ncbi:MAG TPA: hypothetical protein VLA19_02850 [Herpetosiphonaceae bacterium]|nr:hypothetical protein [Herpetosiphonaceae bacterium]